MLEFPVSEQKRLALLERMEQLGIEEKDLEERFIRSSGPGGQHVNKTSTCVVLKHQPTGFEVRCQQERSQSMNRFFARRILADKIEQDTLGKASEELKRREKIKRQKRKRSKRAKAKVLEDKRHQSAKKKLRSQPVPASDE